MSGSIKVGGNTVLTHTGASGAGTITLVGQNGNPILTDDGNAVSVGDLRLPSNGGIKDSNGNSILTESGGNVTINNVRLPPGGGGITDSSGNPVFVESDGSVTVPGLQLDIPVGIGGNGSSAALVDDEESNTAVGNGALANNAYSQSNYAGVSNTAVGNASLLSNTNGSWNTAIGVSAMRGNIDGDNHVAIGNSALYNSSGSGSSCVAIGRSAMANGAYSGSENVAIGYRAMFSSSNANEQTAIGNLALEDNLNGHSNTAVGSRCLHSNTSGTFNAAFGYDALGSNTTGYDSVAVGLNALGSNTTGNNNTGVGPYALAYCNTGSNNVAIGKYSGIDALISITTQSNCVVLGNNSTTNLYCKTSTITTSDIRDKNITGLVSHGLEFVKKLNPIRFFFKASREDETNHGPARYGFSAQEVLALEGDDPVIINNENPENLKMTNDYLVPVLVNAIKEQQIQIDSLTARLDAAGL